MTEVINVGDIRRVSVAFSALVNDVLVATDPTVVTLRWRMHTDTEWTSWVYGVASEVVHDGTGEYHADIPLAAAGRLFVRWIGTGAVVAAEGLEIRVRDLPGELA
jgi:hypothetical protein